jgi:hypothetical protein
MFYRLRVYWRYWRRSLTNFNAVVRKVPWSAPLESCFWLGAIAVWILYMPFSHAQHLFERVIWVAVHNAMIAWLALIPLVLGYTWIVKYCTGGRP